MDKKIIEEIKKRVHGSAGHAFMAFGHFCIHKFDEGNNAGEEFRKETDSLIKYLEGLES